MKEWDPVKTLKKKWFVALLNPFLSVVIKPKKCHKWWGKKPKKPAKCLSKGQPNVNLLTFASAKHKPTTECFAQWMSHYKRGFHMICSVLDGSLLCYFDLNSQVFSVIRKPAQHKLPRFLSNTSSVSSNAATGRRENFGEACFIYHVVSILLTSCVSMRVLLMADWWGFWINHTQMTKR